MRKIKMFTVYDEKADLFITPFFMENEAVAIRSFANMVNDPSHDFGRHPSDYTLFHLGEFGHEDGIIETREKRSLGNGVEFIYKPVDPEQPELDLEQ